MSNFKSTEITVYNQKISENSTTENVPLGTIIRAIDKDTTDYGVGEFIYLQGVASTAIGSAVVYNADDFSTTLASANAVGPVAFAMAATVANEYGWYQIGGKAVGKVLASFADNGDCYLTATAGSLDDADVAGDYVRRCKGASAIDTPSTGLAELEIARPEVADGKDN
jgi:hypothetical protein